MAHRKGRKMTSAGGFGAPAGRAKRMTPRGRGFATGPGFGGIGGGSPGTLEPRRPGGGGVMASPGRRVFSQTKGKKRSK